MVYILTFIIILLVILLAVFALYALSIRKKYRFSLAVEKSKHDYVNNIIQALKNLMEHKDNLDDLKTWSHGLCNILQNDFKASGAFIIQAESNSKNNNRYRMISATGCCTGWNNGNEGDYCFDSDISKQFFWSNQSHIISGNDLVDSLPESKGKLFDSALAATFEIHQLRSYLVVIRDLHEPSYNNDDKLAFDLCFQIFKAGFEIMNHYQQSQEFERGINSAHEEGMLQISTGIIHNIGNGIAVLKIALDRLKDFSSIKELSSFLEQEILPALEQQLVEGSAGNLKQTTDYLNAIREIVEKMSAMVDEHETELKFISNKFQNVIEIITLQQQFIGELGTENVVNIRSVLTDVIKMIETPIEESDIGLKQNIDIDADVLVDPALLRQVMLTICKYSVHSINMVHRSPATIEISASLVEAEKEKDDAEDTPKKVILIKINDNGYGIEFKPEAKFSTPSQSAQQHRELLFCKNKIEKYGGSFQVKSKFGNGSSVKINLPVYTGDGSED